MRRRVALHQAVLDQVGHQGAGGGAAGGILGNPEMRREHAAVHGRLGIRHLAGEHEQIAEAEVARDRVRFAPPQADRRHRLQRGQRHDVDRQARRDHLAGQPRDRDLVSERPRVRATLPRWKYWPMNTGGSSVRVDHRPLAPPAARP